VRFLNAGEAPEVRRLDVLSKVKINLIVCQIILLGGIAYRKTGVVTDVLHYLNLN
jgi:hypothetical protein